jgi:hypothetical protein
MMYTEFLTGTIDPTGTIIFTGTPGKATIYALRFNNPAAYDITLSRFNNTDGTSTNLYTLNLAAGDIVSDPYSYMLNDSDYIEVTCSVPGTVYTAIVNYTT